jgi:hypothetical protein
MGSAPNQAVRRFVFVAGIEGAGHHLIGAIAKEIMYTWSESTAYLSKYGYRFKNYDPNIFLHNNFPQYSAHAMDAAIASARPNASIFFQAESYPMGSNAITRHPDLYTFSQLRGGAPAAIFVRRNLSAATLSLLRRYGKGRIRVSRRREGHPQPHPMEDLTNAVALHKELEVKETSAFLVQASYNALCTGPNPELECYDIKFEEVCSKSTDMASRFSAFIKIARALGIPKLAAESLNWDTFPDPCKVHKLHKKAKQSKKHKAADDATASAAAPPGAPPVSPYDPDVLDFATKFASEGRAHMMPHAAS